MELHFTEMLYEKIVPKNPFAIKRRLADRLWSMVIRLRDHYTCQRCGHKHTPTSRGLQCSHFFARRREATRFDWDNTDALCLACHLLWSRGAGWQIYSKWKRQRLGFMRYEALAARAKIPNNPKLFDDLSKINEFRLVLDQNKEYKNQLVLAMLQDELKQESPCPVIRAGVKIPVRVLPVTV